MDFSLTKKAVECEKRYESAKTQAHLRAEAMAAGAGRESVDILLWDARPRRVRAEVQTDRILAEGEIVCQAAYRMGGEASARAVTAAAPIACVLDVKGCLSGMTGEAAVEVDEVRAAYENGHIVFDIYVTVRARAVSLVPAEVIVSVENAGTLETRFEDIKSVKLAAETTVSELISKSMPLPAAMDARCVLMEWAEPLDVDARKEPGGLRVTGSVLFETLISTGLSSKPVQLVRCRLPLDRFVEMPEWLTDAAMAEVFLPEVKAGVSQADGGSDGTLNMETEAQIRVTALSEDTASALTDAFSTGSTLVKADKKTYEICLAASRLHIKEPFRASMILKEGAGAVSEVCAVRTRAAVGDVTRDGAGTVLMGVVTAQVIYMTGDGGRMMSESQDLPFEIQMAAEIDGDAAVRVQAVMPEGNALMSDRIEIKCMLEVQAEMRRTGEMTVVQELSEDGPCTKVKGVVIVWPGSGDDAWTIARRYQTTVENVKNASDNGEFSQNPIVIRL